MKTKSQMLIGCFVAAILIAATSHAIDEEPPYIPVRSNKYQIAVAVAEEIVRPDPGKALVILLRPSAGAYRDYAAIYDGEDYLATIGAQVRVSYQATPGRHLFTVIGESADFMDADLQAGQVYYAIVRIRPGNWKTRYSFVPLNGEEAQTEALERLSNTLPYVPNPKARESAAKAHSKMMQRRNEYLPKWEGKPASERPLLNKPVWQSASHATATAPAPAKTGASAAGSEENFGLQ